MKPNLIIPNYLLRWHIIPRNKFFNIYLHKFLGDDEPHYHDHPWPSLSICLSGRLIEFMPDRAPRMIRPGSIIFRRATHKHYLVLGSLNFPWTLFITGPRTRQWFFYKEDGTKQ